MPTFRVRKQVDAYVNYVAFIDAPDAETAVDWAYDDGGSYDWERDGVTEFDDVRVAVIDNSGDEVEGISRRNA
ncbi:MAG: hypothetical protein CMH94_07425 [Oceanicaulis sp.]|uniref:Uncharacterized protein n=1 Tax=Maricaulis virginensis TaxID=144022 RepID=A0A9W6MMZ3_9PROT|nr:MULTISPECIES: hypothetical protein [Alphaproteobacteria]MAC38520.1 hypothetical protein [Oceanicaulis sp.]MBI75418.1 hypothetical protein [Oceanicaulis sp.]GLK51538.1 hypothetical protein GCM10017621_10460 [Maricaulis virginensis]|tara:strand:- start:148 stop:366 length:219 start_codon:yes stop_codon:yes gene_type:complete